MPNEIAKEILKLIDINNNKINYPNHCYKIKLLDIFNILKEIKPGGNFIIQDKNNSFEKFIEEINGSIPVLKLEKKIIKEELEAIVN